MTITKPVTSLELVEIETPVIHGIRDQFFMITDEGLVSLYSGEGYCHISYMPHSKHEITDEHIRSAIQYPTKTKEEFLKALDIVKARIESEVKI